METYWKERKRTFLALPLSTTSYELTEDRLFIRKGFFTRVEDEVRLYRIVDVTLIRTFRQRFLGLGTIHCHSTDASQKQFDIVNVPNSRDVKELLSELIEEERMKKHVYQRETLDVSSTEEAEDDSDDETD